MATKKEQIEKRLKEEHRKHEEAKLPSQKNVHMQEINRLLDDWNKEHKNENPKNPVSP